MFKSYGKFWKNYVNFEGKSDRPDYWWPTLINSVISLIGLTLIFLIQNQVDTERDEMMAISSATYQNADSANFIFQTNLQTIISLLVFLFGLAVLLPNLSVTVRRLRDADYHWAFIFLPLIPIVGSIILTIMLCMPNADKRIARGIKYEMANPNSSEAIEKELKKLYSLKDQGLINDEELAAKKKQVLGI